MIKQKRLQCVPSVLSKLLIDFLLFLVQCLIIGEIRVLTDFIKLSTFDVDLPVPNILHSIDALNILDGILLQQIG